MILRFVLVVFVLLVSACSTPPQQTERVEKWGFEGKFSLRSPDKNQSGYIRWQQYDNGFEAKLWGVLGFGTTIIMGNDKRILVNTGAETTYYDTDHSLEIYPSVFIPIGDIGAKAEAILLNGNPTKIATFGDKDQWQAQTLRSLSYNDISRPLKVRIKNDDTQLILLMKRWLDL